MTTFTTTGTRADQQALTERSWREQAGQLMCDLTEAERACVHKAIAYLVDAGRAPDLRTRTSNV
eukprot:521041-Rhodomonas_salina.1